MFYSFFSRLATWNRLDWAKSDTNKTAFTSSLFLVSRANVSFCVFFRLFFEIGHPLFFFGFKAKLQYTESHCYTLQHCNTLHHTPIEEVVPVYVFETQGGTAFIVPIVLVVCNDKHQEHHRSRLKSVKSIQIDLCVRCVVFPYSRVSLSSRPFRTFCTAPSAR